MTKEKKKTRNFFLIDTVHFYRAKQSELSTQSAQMKARHQIKLERMIFRPVWWREQLKLEDLP